MTAARLDKRLGNPGRRLAYVQALPDGWRLAAMGPKFLSRIRRLPWYRFAAGVVAGGAGLLLTFILRILGIGAFLPEIAVDFVVGRIPGSIESFFISTMGEGAKILALCTALAVFLVLPGLYAMPFRRVQAWLGRRFVVLGFYALTSAGIVLAAILPLLGAGFLGAESRAGAGFVTLSQLLGYWLYAAVLDYFLVDVAARHPDGFSLTRRQFLVAGASALAFAALALYGLTSLIGRTGRLVFASVAELFAKELTPVPEFYTVTKNVIDPVVDPDSWRLDVGGLVSGARSYAYSDLEELGATEEYVTLECVSNEVAGNLISTAKWTGVPLASLLQAAGISDDADWVAFTCADGYTVGIPRPKAMEPTTLVAIEMNDMRLTTAHGFPARIVVPGVYGMFHAKWVTRIEAVRGEFRGFWQVKGWTNDGRVHTSAIITTPPVDRVVGLSVTLGGVAFAGDRGISAVEVSTDGGGTWRPATLKAPPLDPRRTWVLWTFDWTPPASGSYRIFARAIDGDGVPQEAAFAAPFPNGASGYDSISLLVSR